MHHYVHAVNDWVLTKRGKKAITVLYSTIFFQSVFACVCPWPNLDNCVSYITFVSMLCVFFEGYTVAACLEAVGFIC